MGGLVDNARCPGCGAPTTPSLAGDGLELCPRCDTPLMVTRRGLDVEYAVRERLYGLEGPCDGGVDAAVTRPRSSLAVGPVAR
jgi:hypothetical protein